MSEVSICNVALSLLAVNPVISLEDDSQQASLCKALYPVLRNAVQEDADWTFAIKRKSLAPTTDTPDWKYTYSFLVPSDCLRLIEVTDQPEFQTNATYRLEWRKEGNRIVCDAENIYIRYVSFVEDTSLFTPMFEQALSQRLAAEMAIPLVESKALYELYMGMYERKRDDAASTDGTAAGSGEKITSGELNSRR